MDVAVTGKQFVVDEDVKAVLEFMQDRIQANKLVGVAEKIPELARLLWVHLPQEPIRCASLTSPDLGCAPPPETT